LIDHLAWVRRQPCCVPECGRVPAEAHHVRTAANSGTGMKPSPFYAVPLCRYHHDKYHRIGRASFELACNVDLDAELRFLRMASGTEMP
jgi:hypothetical protein